jgi:predicted DNA-binding transcriptional regulator AlpA
LLSAAEVGKILRVCKRTVQRYCSMGLLPEPIRINARVVRFRRSDIDSFLAARHTV